MKALCKKLFLLAAGLIAAIVLLEAGLGLAGRLYKAGAYSGRGPSSADGGAKTLLCLGDSFTFGNGAAEGMDYPSQLGRMLKDGGFDIRVVNRGIVGGTTTMVLENLERDIGETGADYVALLIGGTNEIDLAGLLDFIGAQSLRGRVLARLARLRTLRLARAAAKALFGANERRLFEGPAESGGDSREKMPANAGPLFGAGLAAYRAGDYDAALDAFLDFAFRAPDNPLVFDLLFSSLAFCDEREAQVLERLEILARRMPDPYLLYRNLFLRHFSRAQYGAARSAVSEGLRRDPARRDYFNLALQFFRPGREGLQAEREALLFDIEELAGGGSRLALRYLALARRWMRREDESRVFADWILSDTRKILDRCNELGVKVMLQSYPDSYFLFSELRAIADRRRLPFVDQHSMFLEIPFAERGRYFAPDGHCNARGYALMARNIFERMQQCGWIGAENEKEDNRDEN